MSANEAYIGFDQPGNSTQRITEFPGVLRAVGRGVGRSIDGINHSHRIEGSLALRAHLRVSARRIHAFENRSDALIACLKLLEISNGDGVSLPAKGSWHLRPHGNGANRRG
jgi:hypothetical protein